MNWATEEMINWIINAEGTDLQARKHFAYTLKACDAADDILAMFPNGAFLEYDAFGEVILNHAYNVNWDDVKTFVYNAAWESFKTQIVEYVNDGTAQDILLNNTWYATIEVDQDIIDMYPLILEKYCIGDMIIYNPDMTQDGVGQGLWSVVILDNLDFDKWLIDYDDKTIW